MLQEDDQVTKLELVRIMQETAQISKAQAERAVTIFFDEMSDALSRGDRIEIRNFCSFYLKQYKGYTGRNPKTGRQTRVKPKKLPFFKCGKSLLERVNNGRP